MPRQLRLEGMHTHEYQENTLQGTITQLTSLQLGALGDIGPRCPTRGRLSQMLHYKHTIFMPGIFPCIWRMRVCLFAHCDCNQFRAYSVCVCSPHTVIAISFGRIVSVFAVRSNLTAPCLTAKGRVMESGESDSELRSHDIISDTAHMAPSTEQSGASHNNTITHSSPTWAGTLH